MREWKKWKKSQEKGRKAVQAEKEPNEDAEARKHAIDEVEKILSRRQPPDSDPAEA